MHDVLSNEINAKENVPFRNLYLKKFREIVPFREIYHAGPRDYGTIHRL